MLSLNVNEINEKVVEIELFINVVAGHAHER
jgi:hypothetical protein